MVEGLVFDCDEQSDVWLVEGACLIDKFFKIHPPVLSAFPFNFTPVAMSHQVLVLDVAQVARLRALHLVREEAIGRALEW